MSPLARFAVAVAASLLSMSASAYPDKPVTFVVPFSAGGDADLAGRNLGAAAQKLLGQPVVIENKAGASGAIGSEFVANAKPDGYTLLVARVGSNAVLPALRPATRFKWNDFTFLGLLELNPVVCVVNADSPYRTLADLESAVKSHPGKLNYSSSGVGTILHLGSQLLLQAFGVGPDGAAHVAYKGGGDAARAVLSREVDFSCGNLTSAIGLIKGGKLRALVVTTPERAKDIPDVPTAREAGFPQLEAIVGWSALYGPPHMPKDLVARWSEVLAKVAHDPAWLAGEQAIGSIARVLPPAETERFVADQFAVYQELGRKLHIELK